MRRIRENVARSQVGQFLRATHGVELAQAGAFGTSHAEQARQRVHTLCHEPDSSGTAKVFANFVVLCIVVSVVAFCVETIPSLETAYEKEFLNLELFMVAVFTVEFLARLWSSPEGWWSFASDGFNVIDFLSVAPFYVYLLLSAVSPVDFFMLRVFRLFRLVQMLKMARYSKMLSLIVEALRETREVIFVLLLLFIVTVILFSSLLSLVEKGVWDAAQGCYVRHDGACSPFDSVPAAFYWGVTTLTGVGYGDQYPITHWGKLVASVAMIVGVLALALPVVLIGVHMSNTMVFLRSEIDSKTHRKVEHEELFTATLGFDAVCMGITALSDECQRLILGIAACRMRREKGGDIEDHLDDILALAKPTEILSSRMLKRFLDLKRYVNSMDINDELNNMKGL